MICSDLLLYRHVGCPYCERVVRVLEAYDIPYRSRFVTPTHSERDHIKRISGSRTVPLLIDEDAGITMAESANIVDYLAKTYIDGEIDGDTLYVDLPETNHLTVGEAPPDVTLPLVNADYWENVSLSELTDDGAVLVVFYPMDGTGAASYIWIQIRERGWNPDRVVGVSVSTPYAHREFIHDHDLPYRLYSDPGNIMATEFGVVHDQGGMTGLKEARPAMFLLEPAHTISYAWVTDRWPASIPYDEIERRFDQSSS